MARPTAAPPRRRGPPPRLTGDQVLEAAWALLVEDGLDGFSMRRLAERLGVAPMTVYGYFPSQDALFDAVLDAGATALRRPDPDMPWRDQLRFLATQLHRFLVRHPFVVRLRLRNQLISPRALRFAEAVFAALRQAGFSDDDAAWAFRTLFVYTFGHAGFSTPDDALDQARSDARAALAVLPADEYPSLIAAADSVVASLDRDESFAHGLELFLDALGARLARP